MTLPLQSHRPPNFINWVTGTYQRNGYTIKVKGNQYYANKDGQEIGNMTIAHKGNKIYPHPIAVHYDWRKKGVVTAMLDIAQHHTGKALVSPDIQSDSFKGFWAKYQP